MTVELAWRERILTHLLVSATALLTVGLPFLMVLSGAARETHHRVLAVLLYGALLMACLGRRQLSYRARAVTFLAVIYTANVLGLAIVGFHLGPGVALALTVVLCGLLLGERASAAALILTTLTIPAVGTLIAQGVVPAPAVPLGDPTELANWGRATVAYGTWATVLALTVGYVIQRLQASVREKSRALAVLQEEQRGRAQAETARDHALLAAIELQKSEALGRLASGVAHDFNNALQVIIGCGELARLTPSESERVELLTRILQAGEHATQLTQTLLSFSRRDVIRPTPIPVAEFLEQTCRTLRRLLSERIELEQRIDTDAHVLADRTQLEQIVLNLGINARDAMPEGGRLTLAARDETRGGRAWVRIALQDTGSGIEASIQERVFEPFFTTKAAGEGTGLGLSTVRTLVEELGGEVELESAVGEGATFRIWLPRCRPDERPDPAGASGPATSTPRRATGTVLLAEDDPAVRQVMRLAVIGMGCEVVEAQDGDEALALARRLPRVDVLCTDAIMPGLATQSLIEQVLELHPQVSVLVCSGHVNVEPLRQDLEAGRYEFLRKPFSPERLQECLHTMLQRASAPVSEASG